MTKIHLKISLSSRNISVHCCKYLTFDSKMNTNKSLIFLVELLSPSVQKNLHLSAFLYCKGNVEKGSNYCYVLVFITSLVIIRFDNKAHINFRKA